MDDYLAKPFRRTALRIVLERWVLDHPLDGAATGVRADGSSADTLDARALDHVARTQGSGLRLVAGLVSGFFDDATGLIETIDRARERSDLSSLAHGAHVLGLRSEFVGARRLSWLCGGLERAGRAGESTGLDLRIAEIRREYEAVRLEMESV
jgi:HPt (histidine-containing phosphotransfer) domain-containing protein